MRITKRRPCVLDLKSVVVWVKKSADYNVQYYIHFPLYRASQDHGYLTCTLTSGGEQEFVDEIETDLVELTNADKFIEELVKLYGWELYKIEGYNFK